MSTLVRLLEQFIIFFSIKYERNLKKSTLWDIQNFCNSLSIFNTHIHQQQLELREQQQQ